MEENKTITKRIQEETTDFLSAPRLIKVLVVFFLLLIFFNLYNEIFRIPTLKTTISQLEKINAEKMAEIQRLETQLIPFKTYALEKFPSEDINTALKLLNEEIKKLKTMYEKTKKTVFSAEQINKKKMNDGSFVYLTQLIPIGNNIIPILTIKCQTQNQAEIKVFEVRSPTLPPMSFDTYSDDKTMMKKEFRSLYPAKISIKIITNKDAGHLKLTVDPFKK